MQDIQTGQNASRQQAREVCVENGSLLSLGQQRGRNLYTEILSSVYILYLSMYDFLRYLTVESILIMQRASSKGSHIGWSSFHVRHNSLTLTHLTLISIERQQQVRTQTMV